MSLDLVGLPCEIRFKIFDHVSVADLTKWLKIQKLRDSILAFLEDEGKFFILENSLWSLVTSFLLWSISSTRPCLRMVHGLRRTG